MKSIARGFAVVALAVAFGGTGIALTATPADAAPKTTKGSKGTKQGNGTKGGKGTKGVSGLDLGSGR